MTTRIFNPQGELHSKSKNLRGLLDNARHRGVKEVTLSRMTPSCTSVMIMFNDNFYGYTIFADFSIAKTFCMKRWPKKTTL